MSGHGGKRAGAGRPSAFALEQKQKAAVAQMEGDDEEVWQQVVLLAKQGVPWAVKVWADKRVEKAGTRQIEQVDTEIVIIQRFPDKPFVCPQCGYKEDAVVVERSTGEDIRINSSGDMEREEEGGGDQSDDTGDGPADGG